MAFSGRLSATLRLLAAPLLALSLGLAGIPADAAPERTKAAQTKSKNAKAKKPAPKKKATVRKGKAKPAAKRAPPRALSEAEMIGQSRFAPEEVGYVLFDARTGAVLGSHEPHRLFLPASVAKVPTAVAALNLLGPDHRFVTALLADGTIAGGALDGDLYLKGGGDPYLMSEDLGALVDGLRARGITRITGRFRFDASLLPTIDQIDPVQPDAAQYNPGLSALSINFNRIAFAWEHGGTPDSLKATAYSESRARSIPLEGILYGPAPPGGRADVPLVRAAGRSGEFWLVSPHIGKSGRTWLPLRRPAVAAARIFRALAAEAGIALPPPEAGTAPERAQPIATHESEPLAEVLRKTLRYSNNLAAELVGLAAARRLTDELLSLDQASDAVGGWYRQTLPHVTWEGFDIENFSGLSSTTRMSPAQVAAVLTFAADQHYGEDTFFSLLPEKPWEVEAEDDGKSGKGKKSEAPDIAIRAKTGTVAYGRGLAGYIDRGARRLGFVIFISDLDARRRFDASEQVRALILPPKAKAWLRRARAVERSLVLKWAASGAPEPPPAP